MKKLLSVVLAACLTLCGTLSVIGCGSIDDVFEPENKTRLYYLYNPETDTHVKTEYMEIDGSEFSLVKNNDGITVTSGGTISFNSDNFTIVCDSELLGVSITNIMNGEREGDGVLRVDSKTVMGMTSTPTTYHDVYYYCLENSKPLDPIIKRTVTLDGNGGTFASGASSVALNVGDDGKVNNMQMPVRNGYYFAGYYMDRAGNGAQVTIASEFSRSVTLYAKWSEVPSSYTRYYSYDAATDEYDKQYYLDIYGSTATVNMLYAGMAMRFDGSVQKTDSEITLELSSTVYLMISITLSGKIDKNGAIILETMRIDGLQEQSISDCFCKEGVKPAKPDEPPPVPTSHKITFVCPEGGAFSNGSNEMAVMTDPQTGKVEFPAAPKINGYVIKFYYVYTNPEAGGGMHDVTPDTVFEKDAVVFYHYEKLLNVTFVVDGKTVETRQMKKGDKLGKCDIPDLIKNRHMFKGWVNNGKYYVERSVINSDIVLTADYYTYEQARDNMDDMSDWSEPGHLYIHYLRYDAMPFEKSIDISRTDVQYKDAAYKDWLLWAWPRGGVGRAFKPIRLGMYGIVYDINMDQTYADGGWNGVTKTHNGEKVQYYGKDVGIMFFDDSSRMKDSIWKSDGGNLYLNKSLLFEYYDTDVSGNPIGDPMYIFDGNNSVHLLFTSGSINQKMIDGHQLPMITLFDGQAV